MTQDELKLVLEALKWCHGGEPCGTAEAIAVIEKALAQPEQKPVGYVIVKDHGKVNILDFDFDLDVAEQLSEGKYPAYTTPPKRTWVGLTDEEVENYWDWEDFQCGCGRGTLLEMVLDIQAKLKERNA